jgi:hypothetical protein
MSFAPATTILLGLILIVMGCVAMELKPTN